MTTEQDTKGYAVAGSAYGKKGQLLKASLTHSVNWSTDTVLCGGVKIDNMLDDEMVATPLPTCPKCLKKLGK